MPGNIKLQKAESGNAFERRSSTGQPDRRNSSGSGERRNSLVELSGSQKTLLSRQRTTTSESPKAPANLPAVPDRKLAQTLSEDKERLTPRSKLGLEEEKEREKILTPRSISRTILGDKKKKSMDFLIFFVDLLGLG